jgi:hypothetical protein
VKRIPTFRTMLGKVALERRTQVLTTCCERCGATNAPGRPCPSCAAFDAEYEGHSIHFCGGCGVGFLVAPTVAVQAVAIDGVSRTFCSCCHDFLGDRLASSGSARLLGYDMEGHAINSRFPDLTPTGKLRHRAHQIQVHLSAILERDARRQGARPPAPLFLVA